MRYTPDVMRRLHVRQLHIGNVRLPEAEAHHARDVLRMEEMSAVELFDDAGQTARGRLNFEGSRGAFVSVEALEAAETQSFQLTIASAVPKGERADWMIEKLSELGVSRFIPLATERSVVHPGGKNKKERWERLAVESAKQSRRAGMMRIDDLTTLMAAMGPGWFLATEMAAETGTVPIWDVIRDVGAKELRLFIGPEGGWTDGERAAFTVAGLTGVRLTDTILRIETAAIAAAAVVMCAR
jgi:16S rRNA (uracil1498-N3)-methyltransferase